MLVYKVFLFVTNILCIGGSNKGFYMHVAIGLNEEFTPILIHLEKS